MRLLLIRHARIAGDPFICPPRPVSGCLSDEGLRQAQALNLALAAERIDCALSSPYGRALQTCEIAIAPRDIPVVIVPGFEEWTPAPAVREMTDTEFEALCARNRELHAEETWKTEAGEGCFDMYARIVPAFLNALAAQGWRHHSGAWVPDDDNAAAKTIAIFAHGGSLNIMLSFLLTLQPFPVGRFAFDLTGVAAIDFTPLRNLWHPALKIGTM
ncbi:MAG: phosphoglycerate mutase family protein [Kiritimatiellaeota bacterium]|nr:phosphoglycerate mutase family protein [Kiritimatiellota bacterium]